MKIGFAGLGDMGSLIVPRLMAAGHEVDRLESHEKQGRCADRSGMRWADTPARGGARRRHHVLDPHRWPGRDEVALGTDGIAPACARARIYIDMSTISPTVSRTVADEFAAVGS